MAKRSGVSVDSALAIVVSVGRAEAIVENDGLLVAITDIDARKVTPLEALFTLVPEITPLDDGLPEMIEVADFVMKTESVFDTVGNIVIDRPALRDIDAEDVTLDDFFEETVEEAHCVTESDFLEEKEDDGDRVFNDDETDGTLDVVDITLADTETRIDEVGLTVEVNKDDGVGEFVSVAKNDTTGVCEVVTDASAVIEASVEIVALCESIADRVDKDVPVCVSED